MSLNKVMLIGNVGKDPNVRYLDQNSQNPAANAKVATFPLATSERYRDRNGEVRETTEWHNIVAWRGNADVCERFVKKGTQLYIEGHLRTRNWTDQTGQQKYTTEVIADTVQLLGRRPDNPGAQGDGAYQGGSQPSYQGGQAGAPQPAYQPASPSAYQPSYPAAGQPVAAPAAPQAPAGDEDDLPF